MKATLSPDDARLVDAEHIAVIDVPTRWSETANFVVSLCGGSGAALPDRAADIAAALDAARR